VAVVEAVQARLLAGDAHLLAELVAASAVGLRPSETGHSGAIDRAELEQEAARALLELASSFDPRDGDFRTYAIDHAHRRLARLLRAERRRRSRIFPLDGRDEARLAADPTTRFDAEVENPRLRRALRRLSPRLRALIARIYWDGRTTREIADEQGGSAEATRRMLNRAQARLRALMAPRRPLRDGTGRRTHPRGPLVR
jgi:RNA polymerase sigma factor (sigma-70 family)